MRRFSAISLAGATLVCLGGIAAAAETTARLHVRPLLVARGSVITITGSGFRPTLRVSLTMKRPSTTGASRLATVRASRAGSFRISKLISRSAASGLYVVTACQSGCSTKATARFRVAKIKPVWPTR